MPSCDARLKEIVRDITKDILEDYVPKSTLDDYVHKGQLVDYIHKDSLLVKASLKELESDTKHGCGSDGSVGSGSGSGSCSPCGPSLPSHGECGSTTYLGRKVP